MRRAGEGVRASVHRQISDEGRRRACFVRRLRSAKFADLRRFTILSNTSLTAPAPAPFTVQRPRRAIHNTLLALNRRFGPHRVPFRHGRGLRLARHLPSHRRRRRR